MHCWNLAAPFWNKPMMLDGVCDFLRFAAISCLQPFCNKCRNSGCSQVYPFCSLNGIVLTLASPCRSNSWVSRFKRKLANDAWTYTNAGSFSACLFDHQNLCFLKLPSPLCNKPLICLSGCVICYNLCRLLACRHAETNGETAAASRCVNFW